MLCGTETCDIPSHKSIACCACTEQATLWLGGADTEKRTEGAGFEVTGGLRELRSNGAIRGIIT